MKITIPNKSEILSPLRMVCGVVEKKSTLQVLSNIYLQVKNNSLTLKATDLEIRMETSIPVNVEESGDISVSAKNFLELINVLPDKEISIQSTENNWLNIQCGSNKTNIVGMPAEDFPSLPTFENAKYAKLNIDTLKRMIDHTDYAISTDESRYHMNGIYLDPMDNTRMVATDGQRLALFESDLFDKNPDFLNRGVIIPRKGVQELKKLLDSESDLEMSIEGSHLIIRGSNVLFTVRLIEGQFPDVNQVIPNSNARTVGLQKNEFLDSLKRVALLANERSRGVKLNLTNGKLQISTNNPDLGEAKDIIEAEYQGEDFEIAFNANYLRDALSAVEGDVVELGLNERMNPGVVSSPSEPHYLSVIMPMRL